MKPTRFPALSLALGLALLALAGPALAERRSVTIFEGTQYPLTVHFLQGEQPGPTVLVQGGIQGDEPSGFLTAQLLARAQVERGNLVVIPRANVPTVHVRKRLINVDLNRRFDRDYGQFFEDRLARAIRFLLAGCDAFIHLHEGSGFYSPTYQNILRNPDRYGQSVIIDARVYHDRIDLAGLANSVLARINSDLRPADYRFALFNMDTFAANTAYPEQRKSLTYYVLSQLGIPALAIEVSKNIPDLGWKVRQQLRATRLFLEGFGVELTLPDLSEREIERFAAQARTVSVNGKRVRPGETLELTLSPGERISAAAEDDNGAPLAPAPSVIAADRPDVNMLDAPRLAMAPVQALDVRADGSRLARIAVRWSPQPKTPAELKGRNQAPVFAVWLNKKLRFVPAGGAIEALAGDQLMLDGVWGGKADEVLNLKGFVSQPGRNDGQDMGQEIILDPEDFIARYIQSKGKSWVCRVVRETRGMRRCEIAVHIAPRAVSALVLVDAAGKAHALAFAPGATASLPAGEYRLEDAKGNGPKDKLLLTLGGAPLSWGATLRLNPGQDLPLTVRQATTFKPLGQLTLTSSTS